MASAAAPMRALAFFKRKIDALETEISLLEQRMSSTDLSAGQARATITRLTAAVTDAHAIGDLDSLKARLSALAETIEHRREEHKAAREQAKNVAREGQGTDRLPRPSGWLPRPRTGRQAASGCVSCWRSLEGGPAWRPRPLRRRCGSGCPRPGNAFVIAARGPTCHPGGRAGRHPRAQGRPGHSGRRRLSTSTRLGGDRYRLSRAHARLEASRPGGQRAPRTNCGPGSRARRTRSSRLTLRGPGCQGQVSCATARRGPGATCWRRPKKLLPVTDARSARSRLPRHPRALGAPRAPLPRDAQERRGRRPAQDRGDRAQGGRGLTLAPVQPRGAVSRPRHRGADPLRHHPAGAPARQGADQRRSENAQQPGAKS